MATLSGRRLAVPATLVLAVAIVACDRRPPEVLTVAGPKSREGAELEVDGKVVGTLQPLALRGGLIGGVLRKLYPSSGELLDAVGLNVGVGLVLSRPGTHRVVLAPRVGPPMSASFVYPFQAGEDQCFIFALSDHLDVSDSCRPHGLRPGEVHTR